MLALQLSEACNTSLPRRAVARGAFYCPRGKNSAPRTLETPFILIYVALALMAGMTGIAKNAEAQNLFVANSGNNAISEITPSGTVSTFASGSGLNVPRTLVFDATGNLYFSNAENETISEITTNGTIITFAS